MVHLVHTIVSLVKTLHQVAHLMTHHIVMYYVVFITMQMLTLLHRLQIGTVLQLYHMMVGILLIVAPMCLVHAVVK